MMKRTLACLFALLMLFSGIPAFAGNPKPVEKIPYDQITPTRDGIHHYLLLCMDQWEGGMKGSSDGIVLLTFDTRAGRIMLTSFLRDSLVERPNGNLGRINNIVKDFGPEALCEIISTHMNIKVEKYVIFNFQQIANIVDYMGGVEIPVEANEAAYLKRYPLEDHQTTPPMGREGTYLFTGRAAVIYMRMRKHNTGDDFMRTARVRKVLSLLADKCRVMTYDQAKSLLDNIVENSTKTNMNGEDLIEALKQAFSLRSCVIEELRLPHEAARTPMTYKNMSVHDVDWALCREEMAKFLECSWLVIENESDEHFD